MDDVIFVRSLLQINHEYFRGNFTFSSARHVCGNAFFKSLLPSQSAARV